MVPSFLGRSFSRVLAVGPAWEPAPRDAVLRSSTARGSSEACAFSVHCTPSCAQPPSPPLTVGGSPACWWGVAMGATLGYWLCSGCCLGPSTAQGLRGAPTQPAGSGVSQEGSGRGPSCTRTLGRRVEEGGIQHPREAACHSWGPSRVSRHCWTEHCGRPGLGLAWPAHLPRFTVSARGKVPAPSTPMWSAPMGSLVGRGRLPVLPLDMGAPCVLPGGRLGQQRAVPALQRGGAERRVSSAPSAGPSHARPVAPQGIWRIPWTRSAGRAAAWHMNRSVVLLLKVLAQLRDHGTLLRSPPCCSAPRTRASECRKAPPRSARVRVTAKSGPSPAHPHPWGSASAPGTRDTQCWVWKAGTLWEQRGTDCPCCVAVTRGLPAHCRKYLRDADRQVWHSGPSSSR